jgi:hypothetical protein
MVSRSDFLIKGRVIRALIIFLFAAGLCAGCQTQRAYEREQETKIKEYQKAYEARHPEEVKTDPGEPWSYVLALVVQVLMLASRH